MDSDTEPEPAPGIHVFLMEAHQVTIEARFIIHSLPNADIPAVERICLQLEAIRHVLINLDDAFTTEEERDDLIQTTYRQIFFHLEESNLLDMNNIFHRICLILVFRPRIQQSLNRTMDAWNHHKIRTAGNRTPLAIFELSREQAILGGYWTGDPGDPLDLAADPQYGVDEEASAPPPNEMNEDPQEASAEEDDDTIHELDEDLQYATEVLRLSDLNLEADDGAWGMGVYSEAVFHLQAYTESHLE
ncbi:hypothetical protein BV25DRAFT_1815421 [Artomyces pyxidatus]|uniref:Uncharacterized protein n=1 Tax=Artomyces pyxidatus TaxID=48021 RepID=A0ACB8SHY0_9AGAM|nr:hypothetical protein BV25DRAFT_1815421 [Artomyces pyxidatus]